MRNRAAYNIGVPAVNNVTRLLDTKSVLYAAFELPPKKLSALEVAAMLGVEPRLVFKTIVVKRDRPQRPVLAIVPATCTVDLKQVAAALGDKKVYLPTEREAESITGLQAGGISALALLNRGFAVLVDEAGRGLQEMHVSGGKRGLNIRLAVSDFITLTGGHFASIGRDERDDQ